MQVPGKCIAFMDYLLTQLIILQWLEQTFLKYINDWDRYVKSKDAIPKAAKQFCMLPPQTITGLEICGK